MDFYEKSLNILELPVVLDMLAAEAVTDGGKEACRSLRPSSDRLEVKNRLAETSAAKEMMVVRGSPSLSGIKDIRPSLSRADLGGSLNTIELLNIARVLQCARLVKGYTSDDKLGKSCIDHLFAALHANRFLEEKITGSIVGEDEISDSASSELANIRRKIRAASARVRDCLQKIISSPSYAKVLQEPIITMRSDRFVVPVKAECKGAIPGLVHDISASGATLFIEPMAAVKANNELRELAAKEKTEIERILAELSADCAAHAEDIASDYSYLITLDGIFARAKLSYKLNGIEPELREKGVVLRRARHPLLPKDKAVPISLELGEDFDTLIITGPNTGGKTVTLKTIGLLNVMAQCGLHIPADDGSGVPVYRHVLADIGDEQSIEQNLSTFSAHMTNIVHILGECDADSLLLFDELGAGTDPTEGAALAIAVIEHARKMGANVAATTHYAELKVYATNENGIQNASCEFDVETLSPTYKLLVGVPGKSNAFAISERLGLSKEIIDDAKARIGVQNASFEATIEKLEQTRALLERDRAETAKKLREAEESAKKAAFLRAELSVRLEKADEKAKRDAERIIAEARQTAENTFAELDEMRRKMNDDEQTQEINHARSELRRKLNESQGKLKAKAPEQPKEEKKSARDVRAGDTVEIKSMGVKAEVIDVNPDGTLNLRAGIMNVKLKPDDVYLIEGHAAKQKKQSVTLAGSTAPRAAVSPEIDLRGMESIEAVNAAEQYIDSAVMGKLKTVTIIHGKGTGALRAAVQQMLKRNKAVKSYRLGRFGEGESGVTIVELK
ncbi:MAG: endonuclease MutS2 [Oscillospiraceae bacterium]|nr:endonuclease MutS2 [Oscillospiraceae bacterium]